MIPVYFPFTRMKNAALKEAFTLFDRVTVYLPSELSMPASFKAGSVDPRFNIRIPVEEDTENFGSILKQHREWADLHQADGMSYFKAAGDAVPYFDDTSTSAIRCHIRSGDTGASEDQNAESLMTARVFLHIAQELDQQKSEVRREFKRLHRRELDLFDELKGEGGGALGDPSSPGGSAETEDPGIYMPEVRMAAWSRLFFCRPEPSPLYITTSPSIFNYVSEHLAMTGTPFNMNVDALAKEEGAGRSNLLHSLNTLLEKIAAESWTDKIPDHPAIAHHDEKDGIKGLSIRVISNRSPTDVFSSFLFGVPCSQQKQPVVYKNTLIGLLAP